jgi:uncharacterized membrane-anchored protein YhcB (DUF1043 family)
MELLRQQTASAWLIAVLALVGAAVGAFASSYLRKRGEDLAMREGFDEIRAQLETTTRDTEEIKQRLSSHTWRTQQQWSSRERYYNQLLTQLHHFKLALDDLSDYYIEPGTEHMPDSERGEAFQKLLADASAANAEIKRLVGPAALFLSARAVKALGELMEKHWGLATFEVICTADYVSGAHSLVSAAYEHVLREARVQLGIEGDA